jgi:ADP-ribose pyrophosphatase
MNKWQIIKSKTIHKTEWIEVVADECMTDTGQLVYTYTRRVDKGPLIIPEQDGKLWMVRQYRHPIRKVVWQFPTEGMHQDETWEDAAQRGLGEELGLQASEWIFLSEFFPDPGGLDQIAMIFLARELTSLPYENHLDEHEEIERGLFSMDEIEELIGRSEICDGWTLGALYLYKQHKRGL